MIDILVLGANGFIGSHLCREILTKTNWRIVGMDLDNNKINDLLPHARFAFSQGDITLEKKWIDARIKESDVIIPLAGIATPALYVKDPLRIFEIDFEANLDIIRACVRHRKRVIFPSTSEVYGMSQDVAFDETASHLVTGPIHKERWIYSTSKQLLDRIIYAHGKQDNLPYTLFRPFNWYGPCLDDIYNANKGSSRVVSQFIGNILRKEPLILVNGGAQRRAFTFIDDGIDALLKIIVNKNGGAAQRIFNIGNPYEIVSIRELAETLIQCMQAHSAWKDFAKDASLTTMSDSAYYGAGYQDIAIRAPNVARAEEYLQWKPLINLKAGLKKTLDFYESEIKI